MRYIETWLTGLGLDYIIPKLKAQGITTPKKLAALSLRDIYEVVGVEDTEDRKKLYFLIRRLKLILKSKSGEADDDDEDDDNAEEPAEEDEPSSNPVLSARNRIIDPADSPPSQGHEISPKDGSNSPVENSQKIGKSGSGGAASRQPDVPPLETAESQEDLRRLRLNHRRQAQNSTNVAPPATSTTSSPPQPNPASLVELNNAPEVATAPASRTRKPAVQAPAVVRADSYSQDEMEEKRVQPVVSRSTRQRAPPVDPSVTPVPVPVPAPVAPSVSAPAPVSAPVVEVKVEKPRYKITASAPKVREVVPVVEVPPPASSTVADDSDTNDAGYALNNNNNNANSCLRVVVRKRPLSNHEVNHKGDRDIIEIGDMGALVVRDIKVKVDLTKVIQSIPFQFDDAFADHDSNRTIYENCLRYLVPDVLGEGMKVSCFTYGQTGSGKTYTMFGAGENATNVADEGDRFGLYHLCMADVLHMISQSSALSSSLKVYLTCFEIYGEKLFDLLNNRNLVKCLEDAKQHVRILGLTEHEVSSLDQFQRLLQCIVTNRSTSTTGANHDSSRSHQVLELSFKYVNPNGPAPQQAGSISRRARPAAIPASQLPAAVMGKIVFVDLAGSEKAADTFQNSKSTRMEGADINTSLLALKEVFRSMEKKQQYMPFRGSKLTQVLKESLQGKSVRTCMIACVSPASSHYEQTMNTLRYAAKVYEVTAGAGASGGNGVEEGPAVAPNTHQHHLVSAADLQELQHHVGDGTNSGNGGVKNRATSAPRGGVMRQRSGNALNSNSSNNINNSNNGNQSASGNANKRLSTGLARPASAALTDNGKISVGKLTAPTNTSTAGSVRPGSSTAATAAAGYTTTTDDEGAGDTDGHYTAEDEGDDLPSSRKHPQQQERRRSLSLPSAPAARGGIRPAPPAQQAELPAHQPRREKENIQQQQQQSESSRGGGIALPPAAETKKASKLPSARSRGVNAQAVQPEDRTSNQQQQQQQQQQRKAHQHRPAEETSAYGSRSYDDGEEEVEGYDDDSYMQQKMSFDQDEDYHVEEDELPVGEQSMAPTEEIQMTWGLLSAHKLSIAEMVEVMKEEMELVQVMENVDERNIEHYLSKLQDILDVKRHGVHALRQELSVFQDFRNGLYSSA